MRLSIFVSYRRDDSAGYAGRLIDGLSTRFSADQLFLDIDAIPPGADYAEYISAAVGACDIVLVVIGRQFLTLTDSSGQRRLDDPSDFVRLEILAGLERGVRVAPILVQDAVAPHPDDLPEAIRGLARRQAFPMSDDGWKLDLQRLIAALDALERQKQDQMGPAVQLGAIALRRLPKTTRRHPIAWGLVLFFLSWSVITGSCRLGSPRGSPEPSNLVAPSSSGTSAVSGAGSR